MQSCDTSLSQSHTATHLYTSYTHTHTLYRRGSRLYGEKRHTHRTPECGHTRMSHLAGDGHVDACRITLASHRGSRTHSRQPTPRAVLAPRDSRHANRAAAGHTDNTARGAGEEPSPCVSTAARRQQGHQRAPRTRTAHDRTTHATVLHACAQQAVTQQSARRSALTRQPPRAMKPSSCG